MGVKDVAGQLPDAIQAIVDEVNLIGADLVALRATVLAVQADVSSLYTRLDGHVHGGVTAGGANTSAIAAATGKSSSAPAALTKNGLKDR